MDMLPLSDMEVRVLGALVEKEMTTPMSYPLTLNAVVTACNQKSNRFPVVEYREMDVLDVLDGLRKKRLVDEVFPGSSRVAKYKQNLAYELGLSSRMQALLCVMMLRGPQTVGELRTRTERMARFPDLKSITDQLNEMIHREEGALVTMMPPGPGQKERRYGHLLAGEPQMVESTSPTSHGSDDRITQLEETVEILKGEVAELRSIIEALECDHDDVSRSDVSNTE